MPLVAARWLFRAAHTASPTLPITATHLHYDRAGKVLEVRLSDGTAARFSAELLRVLSPSADAHPARAVAAGRRHVGIMKMEPVGSYAVRLHFDDLHTSGIYTWTYFQQLSARRFSMAKAYLERLRQQGGSRDPGAAARHAAGRTGGGAVAGGRAGGGQQRKSTGGGCPRDGTRAGPPAGLVRS